MLVLSRRNIFRGCARFSWQLLLKLIGWTYNVYNVSYIINNHLSMLAWNDSGVKNMIYLSVMKPMSFVIVILSPASLIIAEDVAEFHCKLVLIK